MEACPLAYTQTLAQQEEVHRRKVADQDFHQDQQIQNRLDASHNDPGNNTYLMNQNPSMYPQDYDQGNIGLNPQEAMLNNLSLEGGEYGEPMENFPIEALAPFNQGLAAFASGEMDNKGQKLKEARLMEALDRQTSLLDSIAQSYQKNRDLRNKAELRKLKNRLERLENQKLFRELEIQQIQSANDIAQQNNQLIFSHLNAQSQLKANPIVLSMNSGGMIPPMALQASLNSLPSHGNSLNSLPPIGYPGLFPNPSGFPSRSPFGPGPMWNRSPMGLGRPPFFGAPPPAGPMSGYMPMGMPPLALPFNKGPFKLPPINSSRKKKGKSSDSSSSDSEDDSPRTNKSRKGKKLDVDKYLTKTLGKYKSK